MVALVAPNVLEGVPNKLPDDKFDVVLPKLTVGFAPKSVEVPAACVV